jgi:uncharacterized caspase-like protein
MSHAQILRANSKVIFWSVIYYSGHGLAYNGINYMIPVDAKLKADRDIDIEAVDAGKISNAIAGASKLRLSG